MNWLIAKFKLNFLKTNKNNPIRIMRTKQRLTQDICNLSTLCSNYKKLSPTIEFSPLQQQLLCPNQTTTMNKIITTAEESKNASENDVESILNLLKMWQIEGQFKQTKIRSFIGLIVGEHKECPQQKQDNSNNERLRVYANQLENVLSVLQTCSEDSTMNFEDLKKLRHDIEIVKANANWANIIADQMEVNSNSAKLSLANTQSNNSNGDDDEVNANASIGGLGEEVN